MANETFKFALIFLLGLLLLIAIFQNVLFESSNINETPTAVGLTSSGVATQRYEGRPYEHKESGCSVTLMDHRQEKILPNELNLTCSFQILDGYFRKTHQFHGDGSWYVPTPEAPGLEIEYRPTICSFDSVSNTKDGLRKCLRENQIKKIVTTGDSNGRHLRDGILEVMKHNAHFACHIKRSLLFEENGTLQEDDTYFDVPDLHKDRLTVPRLMSDRANWAPTLYGCEGSNLSVRIQVEHIRSARVLDTRMYLSPSTSVKDFETRRQADSVLEYLLKYYYPYRGFPDVWFYTPPFHNTINHDSLQSITLHINVMLKLFSLYLPDTTQLIFLSDATHCKEKYTQAMSDSFKEHWNITMDERIHDMNQVLFAEIADEVARKSNYHVFLDATRVACPITCTWHYDAAHMLPIWYYKMAEYTIDLLCASE